MKSEKYPGMLAKMLHEKDVPIQVAIGNYDLGICGLDWLRELTVKYPSSGLVELRNLDFGGGVLYMAAGRAAGLTDIGKISSCETTVRIVSEYPNMAEAFALKNRLRRFSIYPLWGAAGAYPPETAELALIRQGEEVTDSDLVPVNVILSFNACLIANRNSWEKEDLSSILESIDTALRTEKKKQVTVPEITNGQNGGVTCRFDDGTIKLALPDGHAQKHTIRLLEKAGVTVSEYPSKSGIRRPSSNLEGVSIKVIRPQDMPLQVANGNFDLAITGKDWVLDHLYQFPASPIQELLDLTSSWVKIVAVVDGKLPVTSIGELRDYYAERSMPVRVASEYTNIADACARENRLGMYKVIPTWGATEAFLPEDADMLIENTETGGTIARHNLKIIDTLFESTARLIGNRNSITSPEKGERIKAIVKILETGIEEPQAKK